MPSERADAFAVAFQRGERDRAAAQRGISEGLSALRADIEAAAPELTVENTDYDGLFIKPPNMRSGWWAYLVVNTQPDGLTFNVNAGFGHKNDLDSLRDRVDEVVTKDLAEAITALEHAVQRGMYYLGTLKR
ncbi:MAG TPA: hypothetical protein VNT60_07380 [Deinococcales bacterium]|nr:hypothetical protein [Deinococcales bacterium]